MRKALLETLSLLMVLMMVWNWLVYEELHLISQELDRQLMKQIKIESMLESLVDRRIGELEKP